jgi:translation elongation factor EF-1beta
VPRGEGKLAGTFQERVLETLRDPMTLFSIVAAVVVGVGFGIYQLRERIREKKKEARLDRVADEVERTQGGTLAQAPPMQGHAGRNNCPYCGAAFVTSMARCPHCGANL